MIGKTEDNGTHTVSTKMAVVDTKQHGQQTSTRKFQRSVTERACYAAYIVVYQSDICVSSIDVQRPITTGSNSHPDR